MKKTLLFALCLGCWWTLPAQSSPPRPPYCDQLPTAYEKGAAPPAAALPRFSTEAVREYKVQVAILRNTDPTEYPFHPSLVARYRPCEQVWVIESRRSFPNRADAERLKADLIRLGYRGAYLIELVGYQ